MNLREAAEYYRERARRSTKSWPIFNVISKGRFRCRECGGEGSYSFMIIGQLHAHRVMHKLDCPFAEAERALQEAQGDKG